MKKNEQSRLWSFVVPESTYPITVEESYNCDAIIENPELQFGRVIKEDISTKSLTFSVTMYNCSVKVLWRSDKTLEPEVDDAVLRSVWAGFDEKDSLAAWIQVKN